MILYFLYLLVFFIPAYGLQDVLSDGNIDIIMNYPYVVTPGEEFIFASEIKAKADQIYNITATVQSPEIDVIRNQFYLDALHKDSTSGNNFNMKIKPDVPDGTVLVNISVEYFIKGFFDEKPVQKSITKATHLNVQSKPLLIINLDAPHSVFVDEPFLVKGSIVNQGSSVKEVQITAESSNVQLDGKNVYSITRLDSGQTENFEFVLHISKELVIPAEITIDFPISYFDMSNNEHTLEKSINMFARQRGIFEIGDAQGIWVGNFFIAPVVGIGTIVSSVIGFLIFLWHLRNKKKSKRKR